MVIKMTRNRWNEKHAEKKLIAFLKSSSSKTTKELTPYLTIPNEKPIPETIRTRIHILKKKGVLTNIGRGLYTLKTKPDYSPKISVELKDLYSKLQKRFPYTKLCIWELNWLNEFSIHQVTRKIIVVESEKETERAVFDALIEENGSRMPVIFKPSGKDVELYISSYQSSIVVKKLISESPIQKTQGVVIPKLEKLLVDLFVGDPIFLPYKGAESTEIFHNAFDSYTINLSTLKRYAKRRNHAERLDKYLKKEKIIR